jgi:hypothetical protein
MTSLRAAVDPELAERRRLRAELGVFLGRTTGHPESRTVLNHQAHTHGGPFATEAHQVRGQLVAYVTDLIGTAAREARARHTTGADHEAATHHADEAHRTGTPGPAARTRRRASRSSPTGASACPRTPWWARRRNWRAGPTRRPGRQAKEATSALMDLARTGLGRLVDGARWSP